MKNLYILGDSHTLRVAHCLFDDFFEKLDSKKISYDRSHSSSFSNVLKKDSDGNPIKIQKTHFEFHNTKFDDKSINCLSYLGKSALSINYENMDSNSFSSLDTIIPWFGYIDIKNYLGNYELKNYKNVKKVVDIYVKNTLDKFINSEIIFANPMPQFETFVSARWSNFAGDSDINFETRHSIHLEFCEHLRDKCNSLGLRDPIDIGYILNTEWIGPEMQHTRPLRWAYNDHCRPEFYMEIFNYFLNYTNFNIEEFKRGLNVK